jgi:hypothetical protein
MVKSVFFLVFISCSFLGCNHKSYFVECKSVNYSEAISVNLTFTSVGSESIFIKNAKSIRYDALDTKRVIEEVPFSATEFTALFGDFLNTTLDSSTFFAVLYYDSTINQNSVISKELIQAIGLYSQKEDKYYFKLFETNGSQFIETKKVSTLTNSVSNSALMAIAQNIIFKKREAYSLIYIDKIDGNNYYTVPNGRDLLYENIKRYCKMKN